MTRSESYRLGNILGSDDTFYLQNDASSRRTHPRLDYAEILLSQTVPCALLEQHDRSYCPSAIALIKVTCPQ